MNQKIQNIMQIIQQSEKLDAEQKNNLLKAVKDADKELEITAFKLERTEKVKKTTAILLEETIEELEQKRKAVEAQNRELEIEGSLERVRATALGMKTQPDLIEVGEILFIELKALGFDSIRNTQIDILNDEKKSFLNYEYSDDGVNGVTEVIYDSHPIVTQFVNDVRSAPDALSFKEVTGRELDEWRAHRKKNNHLPDAELEKATSLYYYCYSIGTGALGISSFKAINEEKLEVLKRFRNVFDLAYRRYKDITKAEAQAREARIETALERVRAVAMAMRKPDDLLSICEIIFTELNSLGFSELRNSMINIHNDEKRSFLNYDFNEESGPTITNWLYNSNPIIEKVVGQMRGGNDAFFESTYTGKDLEDLKAFRRSNGEQDDPKLDSADSLSYYFYSIGIGAIGISTYIPIEADQLQILKRFKNVFGLAYRRYTDIALAEAQAREAQIEASLERVRAVAMSMNKSDDLLSICEISFKEFQKLGFHNLRNAIIHILNDEKESFMDYDFSDSMGGSITNINYNSHPVVEEYLKQIKSTEDAFAEVVIEGSQLIDWKKFRRESGQIDDNRLDDIPALYYYFHSIGVGDIGISTFNPIDESQIKILKRFRNVFDLAYRTYTDITKAEAQAREAQIELGLERVRARAMAMQKSDELSELVDTVFKELTKLDFSLSWCIINIIDESSLSNTVWAANPNIDKAPDSYHMKFEDYPFHDAMMKGYKEREIKYIYVLEGIEKKVYDEYLFKETEFRKVPEEAQAASRAMEKYVCSFTFSNFGGLQTVGEEPLSDENLNILSRFGKVFDLTYTRFNDLKQAEAQAREGQIEAALERVRSRTMGMQKSEELKEVIQVVYEQFVYLNIHIEHTGFIMDYKARDDMHIWLADKLEVPSEVTIPYFDCAHWNSFNEAKEKGIDFFANHLSFEEKNKFYQDLFKLIPGVPEETLEYYFSCPGLAISTVLLENVGLYIENFSGIPYSDEENNTLMRFGKVFQQTYTRFNDLKQAEAQAREAQIEAALEKVRSRTMAMQKSDELAETAYVLYEQFGLLGENPEQLTIGIIDETHKMWEFWLTLGGNQINHVFKASIDEPIVLNKSYIAWKEQKKSIVIDISGDELKAYYNYFKNLPGYKEFNDFKKNQKPEQRRVINMAFFSNGSLSLSSPKPKPAETIQLLERFASVLEQTYTRFLDLQKAESQAREAKIETALERVRAKAMAMHSSEDLALTVDTFFSELKNLKVTPHRCGVTLIDEESRIAELTVTTATEHDKELKMIGKLKLSGHPVLDSVYNNWKLQKEYHPVLRGDEIKNYYQVMNPQIEYPDFSDDETQYGYYFYFKEGGVFAWTENELTERELQIFRRYTSVLSLTYRRYMDLKDAEAQAREAQIELALERVRASTMAMHKSEELAETASVLFEQFVSLEIVPKRCSIGIINRKTNSANFWMTTHAGKVIPGNDIVPLTEEKHLIELYDAWQSKKTLYSFTIQGEERANWTSYVTDKVKMHLPEYQPDTIDREQILNEPAVFNCFLFSHGFIMLHTAEKLNEKDIPALKRFAGVFEQTYTRFLDLQKAEAQAREAQIEAALEKVRSRSIGMQKSEELKEVIQIIHDQLIHLNFKIDAAGFTMDYYQNNDWNVWIANKYQSLPSQIYIPYVDHPQFNYYKRAKEKGLDFFANTLSFEDKNSIFSYMFEFMGDYPQSEKDQVLNAPGLAISQAFLKNITLWIYNLDGKPYTEEDNAILMRFAKVFEQTYVRFNDLKHAEAQAREAQIEMALEKVRSRTMAMQRSDELVETAAIVFKQLIILGIAPNRLYIAIIKDENGNAEFWITDEDGSKISSRFMVNIYRNRSFQKMYDGWKEQKQSITLDMQGTELKEYFQHLSEIKVPFKGGLSQKRRVQNIAYFSKGFIGIASPDSQPQETIELLERFAAVFNLTYTRFNDLQQAEAQNKIIQAENERKTMELEEARLLQLAMLPKELPQLPNLDIAVYMQTATEVGGDYYDFQVGIDGMLTTVIGDATGHGMKAGTVVTITKSLFNSMAANENILGTFDKISQVIKGMKFRQLAMCLLMMKIRGNRLSISSAAMPPALIYRAKNKSVEELLLKGMPLGTMKKFPYKKIESHLNSGDRILLYSDGLPELANDKGQMFGYDKIKTEYHSIGEKEPEEIVDHLKNSASQWANGKEPDDDVTFVVIKIK